MLEIRGFVGVERWWCVLFGELCGGLEVEVEFFVYVVVVVLYYVVLVEVI